MGPKIILDKSTFQSLSFEEIVTLHNYYFVVVTPVLIMEILGDLTKPKTADSETIKKAMQLAQQLAQKIQQRNSCITANHHSLIINSLLGNSVPMERRPIIIHNESAISNEGKKGVIIEESQEEIALHRWREGKFSEAEQILSLNWRTQTTKPDKLLLIKDQFKKQFPSIPKLFDLEKLKCELDKAIVSPEHQTIILKEFVSFLQIDIQSIQKIFLRWEHNDFKTLKDFSPYAFFCFKIQLFFLQALGLELISTKATNDIDLSYLFYLPFCNIFSSNDKFQKKMMTFFLGEDQSFISVKDLKNDLKGLILEEKMIKEGRKYTPKNPESHTYKLWEKYIDWFPDEEELIYKLEAEENKRMQQIMKDLKEQKITKVDEFIKNSDIEFVQSTIKISPEDLCPCGSGKIFKNCCLVKPNNNVEN